MESHPRQEPPEISKLLRAGVLVVMPSVLDKNLLHAVFREVWQTLNRDTINIFRPFCSRQDITLLGGLSFLIEHEFAHVTSNFLTLQSLILFRVYLIPFDLPGVQGRLMNRQEHILVQYRRLMKDILPRIINDNDYWEGAHVLPPNPNLFLSPSSVGKFVEPSKVTMVPKLTAGPEDHG